MARVLSGIQPSGKLHLGNYFGAIKQHIEMQKDNECFYFIANYHALTSIQEKELIKKYTFDVALDYLSLGLNPQKTVFYCQSDLPEVTELTWLLSIVTPMGLLERAHSYKDKIAKGLSPSLGLFSYPVLMAADILIVDSNIVPVGKDQKQHLEMTRDIAIKFNLTFGETFIIPEAKIEEETAVVPGIDGQKMSKSYNNTIEIFCEGEELKSKVMSIVTDSAPVEAPKDYEKNNVYNILKLFISKDEREEWIIKFKKGGLKYSDLKKRLIEVINLKFKDAREKRKELESEPQRVLKILKEGSEKARVVARETLKRAREACGLNI